jgi:hypothetical protein
MCKTLAFLEAVQVAGFGPRTPADLLPVERLLRQLNYSSRSIGETLGFLDAGGDVGDAESLCDEDRDAVKRLLPERLRMEHGCYPGCVEHDDAAAFRSGLLVPTNTR